MSLGLTRIFKLTLLTCALSFVQLTQVCAQSLVITESSTFQSANTNPLLSGKPWFGPYKEQGQTYRYNQLSITGNFDKTDAIGGFSASQNVADNKVTLKENSTLDKVVGGLSEGNNYAVGNEVNLFPHTTVSEAYGALSLNKSLLRDNRLNVEGNVTYAYGAYSTHGFANSNELNLYAGSYVTYAIGAFGPQGSESNEIILDPNSYANTVIGGLSQEGASSAQFVSISGKANLVIAGLGKTHAQSNYLEIQGEVNHAISALSTHGDALYNNLVVNDGAKISTVITAIASGSVANNYATLASQANAQSLIVGLSLKQDSIYNTANIYGTLGSKENSQSLVAGLAPVGNSYLNQVTIHENANVQGQVIAGAALNEASYNQLTLRGNLQGEAIAGLSHQSEANFNLLTITGNLIGNATSAVGHSANHNTTVVFNAHVTGDVSAANSQNASHNLTVLRGTTEVSGTVFGAQDNGKPLNASNEISINGKATVGSLDGFHRLHILASKESQVSGAAPILTVTNSKGLDLRGKELWVSGIKTDPSQAVHLLHVKPLNKLVVDETTTIYGDDSFVFDEWIPKSEHIFEHELIWTEEGPTTDDSSNPTTEQKPTLPSDPDSALPGDKPIPPAKPQTKPQDLFSHQKRVNQEYAKTLLALPSAALLVLDKSNDLIFTLQDELKVRPYFTPFVKLKAFDSRHETASIIDLEGFSFLLGASKSIFNQNLALSVFLEGGSADSEHRLNDVQSTGDFDYVGLGALFTQNFKPFAYSIALKGGMIESSFESYYERTDDLVKYDSSTPYLALLLSPSLNFELGSNFTLTPRLDYSLTYLKGDDLTLKHQSQNRLELKDSFLQSLSANLDLKYQVSENISLTSGLFYKKYLKEDLEGTIESLDIEAHSLDHHALGLSLGGNFNFKNLTLSLLFKRSFNEIQESAGFLNAQLYF